MHKQIKITIFISLLLFLLLGANFIHAQEINYPNVPGALAPQDFLNTAPPEDILTLYAVYFIYLFFWISGLIAFAVLVYGGVQYMLSTGNPERLVSARNQISGAFFGLLILLSSFVLLNTINPELVSIRIQTLAPLSDPTSVVVDFPDIPDLQTSIDAEAPFGRIVNSIFEQYISDYPRPEEDRTPRMERIRELTTRILNEDGDGIADNLRDQSQDLENATNLCGCTWAAGVRECCLIANPGPGCPDINCYSKPHTTGDPCSRVRNRIQNLEDDNETEIDNLVMAQIELEEEARLLREELARLERVEEFIHACPGKYISSWAQFATKKDAFDQEDQNLNQIDFWDDINNEYYLYNSNVHTPDFATFYCEVGGTKEERPSPSFEIDEEFLTGEESEEEIELIFTKNVACSKEALVGELTDRVKRTTRLLIQKIESVIDETEVLNKQVDELQVLISLCSSQRCQSHCVWRSCGWHCVYCEKWPEINPSYYEGPCPKSDISSKLNEIEDTWSRIRDLIEGSGDSDTPSSVGILTIIDELVPILLEDLEVSIRRPLRSCAAEDWFDTDVSLFSALAARDYGATTPNGRVIREICRIYDESGNQTAYGNCFEGCYLEQGQTNHRRCVQTCLDNTGDERLSQCLHGINFYCCDTKK